jgi:GTPase SAR1 family protein
LHAVLISALHPTGQREFVNMLPLVSNDAVAILFMFDLSRKSTLNSVKEWYRQARCVPSASLASSAALTLVIYRGFNKVCMARLIV